MVVWYGMWCAVVPAGGSVVVWCFVVVGCVFDVCVLVSTVWCDPVAVVVVVCCVLDL
jgi:hypothetical protein